MALSTQNKLYIAVAVLAALGGALYLQQKKQKEEAIAYSPEGAAELPKLEISDDEADKIDKIEIRRPADDAGPGGDFVMVKEGDDWRLTSPIDYPANKHNIRSLLNNLTKLKVNEQVATGTDSYQAFGLTDDQALHAVFHEGDKVVADMYFGVGGSRGQMTRFAGRDGVFGVGGYMSFSFARDLKGWRDNQVMKFDEKKAVSLDLVNEHGEFSFVRHEKPGAAEAEADQDQDAGAEKEKKEYTWEGKFKSGAGPARPIEKFDEGKVGDCLRAFRSLTSDSFGDDKQLADVGLDEPVATVTIVLDDGARRVLLVGDTAEGTSRWAKTEDSPQIYSIGSFAANWATAEVEKFQKKGDSDDKDKKDKDKDKDKKDKKDNSKGKKDKKDKKSEKSE